MSSIEITDSLIKFYKSISSSNPAAQLQLQSTAQDPSDASSIVQLKLPVSLPTEQSNLLIDPEGNISHGSAIGGASELGGSFYSLNDGAPGIDPAADDNLNTAITKIDSWLFHRLIDSPPAPSNFQLFNNAPTTIACTFEKPVVYEVGFIDKTLPYITGLTINIFAASTTSASLNGTVTVSTSNLKSVVGTNTAFTTQLSVGDSIAVNGTCLTVIKISNQV